MRDIKKSYTNGEITVYWEPKLCIHIMNCIRNLPSVYNAARRPWINMSVASTDEIIKATDTCPTGALTWKFNYNIAKGNDELPGENKSTAELTLSKDGPIMIKGDFVLLDENGCVQKVPNKITLCRCGASKNKPFCDDTHKEIGYKS